MIDTFRIFKENFTRLLLLLLMLVLPIYLVQELLIRPYLPAVAEGNALRAVWYNLSILLISMFLYVFRTAVILLANGTLTGKSSGVLEIIDFSVRLWPKMIGTTLLYALAVSCGLMIFFFPGLILLVAYTFYQYIVAGTGLWGRKALFLSSLYAKKAMGKATAIALCSVLIPAVLSYGVTSLTDFLTGSAVLRTLTSVVLFLLTELATCLIQIYVASYVYHTKIDFDMSILQKKRTEHAEH